MALNSLVHVLPVVTAFLGVGSCLIKKDLKGVPLTTEHFTCETDCSDPAEVSWSSPAVGKTC